MNKFKNNIIKVLFGILVFTSFASCDEGGEPDAGMTTTGKFAGDWFVSVLDSDGNALVDHALTSTYNTATNDNTMWIDDHQNGWFIKCKINMNTANGTFSATAAPNTIDSGTVDITEGQISFNAATSKAGHVVDKISFKAEFSYDPGNVLTFEGHKRTGFLEDEY